MMFLGQQGLSGAKCQADGLVCVPTLSSGQPLEAGAIAFVFKFIPLITFCV